MQRRIQSINPDIKPAPLQAKLSGQPLLDAVAAADVVLDCSDRFATRHGGTVPASRWNKPLVSGAAVRPDGQLSVRRSSGHSPATPACIRNRRILRKIASATLGVFAPLVGIVGTMQAAEAIKLIAQFGEPLVGRLLTIGHPAWT